MAAEMVAAARREVKGKPEKLRNVPEVRSTHEILGVPTVSARLGTAPSVWNWGMEIMTKILPSVKCLDLTHESRVPKSKSYLPHLAHLACLQEILRDKNIVQQMANLFGPTVRHLDNYFGQHVSMRVDLEFSDGQKKVGLYSHQSLSVAVGVSTAAFVVAMLEGSTRPGVWFPEEPQGIAIEARATLLKRASQGTFNFLLNKAPWKDETKSK